MEDLIQQVPPIVPLKSVIDCPECEKTFTSTFNKNRHMAEMHSGLEKKHLKHIKKGAKYVCKVCQKEYSHTRDLKKHYFNKHDSHDMEKHSVPVEALFHKDLKNLRKQEP